MIRLFITLAITTIGCLAEYGQQTVKSISNYIETAKANSPLLKDYRNQLQIGQAELQQLKAMHTRSRLEMNGDYLFVPVLVREGGKTFFRWNEQDAVDYYDYDLGESSGHLYVGATWTQPLLGYSSYKVAREQSRINMEIVRNNIHMEENQLERAVTEQYLLCLLDQTQMAFADSIDSLLKRQTDMVRRLAKDGLAKQSDLCLLVVEREANADMRLSSLQSYHTHLMELNLLCGIDDTTDVVLTDAGLYLRLPLDNGSLFTEQFRLDSLNTVASLRSFNLQYRPRLNLFVDGGIQTGSFSQWHRHFGWSAGMTFTWTLFDGKQKHWKERQAELQQQSIRIYRDHAEYQRSMRLRQCLSELDNYDRRRKVMAEQLAGYERVLSDYAREIEAGQVSVLDYLTVLRNKIQTERDVMLMRTNRQLVIAAYNYWNH